MRISNNFDSLLNELHQTNQKILQKNNAFNSSSECSNTVTHVTKINEQTESDYTVLDPGQCESGQAISRNGDRSSSSQPDSVQDLNKMLASLDNFDYLHIDQIPQACLGYGQSERGQSHATPNYHTK
ncbi:unnamed protein product [Schistosoma curassoni]|uniref:Uncharacterized protein n=1 Tax=Schistosoma curassoni TaxID=6186 RepID=A0A183KEX7_9TREM|nr:unnamed protein product [Schistosoma curassoni]